MSSGQRSPTTEQPPIFWQIDAPDDCALHCPSQQSDERSQVSPSTRQPLSAAQREPPPIAGRQSVEQQSPLVAQVSPAGRQPAAGNMHAPPAHTAPQHCVALLHVVVAGEQSPGWHVAVYDGTDIPDAQKCEIDGLPFCFVQGETARRLDGATLDWANGSFVVSPTRP